eukprot:PhF_6_TR44304/c0_g2_i3/m.68357
MLKRTVQFSPSCLPSTSTMFLAFRRHLSTKKATFHPPSTFSLLHHLSRPPTNTKTKANNTLASTANEMLTALAMKGKPPQNIFHITRLWCVLHSIHPKYVLDGDIVIPVHFIESLSQSLIRKRHKLSLPTLVLILSKIATTSKAVGGGDVDVELTVAMIGAVLLQLGGNHNKQFQSVQVCLYGMYYVLRIALHVLPGGSTDVVVTRVISILQEKIVNSDKRSFTVKETKIVCGLLSCLHSHSNETKTLVSDSFINVLEDSLTVVSGVSNHSSLLYWLTRHSPWRTDNDIVEPRTRFVRYESFVQNTITHLLDDLLASSHGKTMSVSQFREIIRALRCASPFLVQLRKDVKATDVTYRKVWETFITPLAEQLVTDAQLLESVALLRPDVSDSLLWMQKMIRDKPSVFLARTEDIISVLRWLCSVPVHSKLLIAEMCDKIKQWISREKSQVKPTSAHTATLFLNHLSKIVTCRPETETVMIALVEFLFSCSETTTSVVGIRQCAMAIRQATLWFICMKEQLDVLCTGMVTLQSYTSSAVCAVFSAFFALATLDKHHTQRVWLKHEEFLRKIALDLCDTMTPIQCAEVLRALRNISKDRNQVDGEEVIQDVLASRCAERYLKHFLEEKAEEGEFQKSIVQVTLAVEYLCGDHMLSSILTLVRKYGDWNTLLFQHKTMTSMQSMKDVCLLYRRLRQQGKGSGSLFRVMEEVLLKLPSGELDLRSYRHVVIGSRGDLTTFGLLHALALTHFPAWRTTLHRVLQGDAHIPIGVVDAGVLIDTMRTLCRHYVSHGRSIDLKLGDEIALTAMECYRAVTSQVNHMSRLYEVFVMLTCQSNSKVSTSESFVKMKISVLDSVVRLLKDITEPVMVGLASAV